MMHEDDGEGRFQLLADNAPVMIWRAESSLGCDWFNQPWLDFTGRTLEQEIGFGWAEGIHPDDSERCISIYREACARGEPFSVTYRLRRADGAYRWVMDNGRPFLDRNGSIAGYLGSCVDVDEMVRANERLAKTAQDHAEAVAQRDHLLHEVQHRVRNNLQLILSIIDMQARAERPESRRALDVVAGRVRSIAKAQALLLDPTGKAQIDLGEYVSSLAQSAAGRAQAIDFRGPSEPVQMALSRAVPLGLMINEILGTRLGDDDQAARVTLAREGGEVRLEIEADEPPSADSAASGAPPPSKLIERLGVQAGARIETIEGEPAKVIVHITEQA